MRQRFLIVVSALLVFTQVACQSPDAAVRVDLTALRQHAVLAAVDYSRLVVEVSAEDLPTPLVAPVDPGADAFTLTVPSGAARRFQIVASRAATSAALGALSVPVYRGEVTVDLQPGSLDLTLPVRPVGMLVVSGQRLDGLALPADVLLEVATATGALDPLAMVDGVASAVLPVGDYVVGTSFADQGATQRSLEVAAPLGTGELREITLQIFSNASKCAPAASPEVRAATPVCRDLVVSVTNLIGTGLTLTHGGEDLVLTADGSAVFPTGLIDGTSYEVTIGAQPNGPAQQCFIISGETGVASASMLPVVVSCGAPGFRISGHANGFRGTGLTLALALGSEGPVVETISVSADSDFSFDTILADNEQFQVFPDEHPVNGDPVDFDRCNTIGGFSTIAGADVTDVEVFCTGSILPWPGMPRGFTDYVRASDMTTPCDGTEVEGLDVCVRAGAYRQTFVQDLDCTRVLSLYDTGSLFAWECTNVAGGARISTTAATSGLTNILLFSPTEPQLFGSTLFIEVEQGDFLFSPTTVWFDNPVVVDDDGGTLSADRTIHITTQNVTVNPTLPELPYVLSGRGAAFIVPTGLSVTLEGSGGGDPALRATGDFTWVEGTFAGASGLEGESLVVVEGSYVTGLGLELACGGYTADGLSVVGAYHATLVAPRAIDCSGGISIAGGAGPARFNRLLDAQILDPSYNGVFIGPNSHDNVVDNALVVGSPDAAFQVSGARQHLQGLTAADSALGVSLGADFGETATDIVIRDLHAYNNGTGMRLRNVSRGRFTNLLIGGSNTAIDAMPSQGTDRGMDHSIMQDVTLGFSVEGFACAACSHNIISSVVAAGISLSGLTLGSGVSDPAVLNTFANLAFAASGTGVSLLLGAANNVFEGTLVYAGNTGSDCLVVNPPSSPGLNQSTCAGVNTPVSGGTLTSAFVGATGTLGAYDAMTTSLWQAVPALTTVAADETLPPTTFGRCSTGTGPDSTCYAYDWSLNGDSDLVGVAALPSSSDVWVHDWGIVAPTSQVDCTAAVFDSLYDVGQGRCVAVFLRHAQDASVGDDDGLCESGETCTFMPDIGRAQNSGTNPVNLIGSGPLTSVNNVTLLTP